MATISIPAGDLALEGGTLVFCSGKTFYRQKLASRFKFFAGTWFLDRRQGIPYFRDVFIKNPNLDLIRTMFRRVITTCPGVKQLKKFTVTFDARARTLRLDFEALLIGDESIVIGQNDRDFIIDLSV